MRTLIKDIVKKEGEEVELSGWVAVRRDHGKLIFIDLRDRSEMTQVVFLPSNAEAHKMAEEIRPEWVVKIKGKVNRRPENMVNKEMTTGEFEIEALEIEILNKAETPPIEIESDGYEIGEEVRMKYRYLDLRRNRLQKNIRKRARIMSFIRGFLEKNDFVEIETPILTKSTPEGARDYLVPSRVSPGKFYALPQSPQQYKQLLMVGGMERYFQMAKCFRDEDTRGDRQPEFTQLDMEMSFVEMKNVMKLNEKLLVEIIEEFYPEKKIQEKPFPIITYKEAMEKYGTDRPDLRKDKNDSNLLAFCWVIDFPFFEKTEEGGWTFTHNPFSAPKPEFMEDLISKRNIGDILTTQYDVALNGIEVGGGSIRNHKPEALLSTLEIMGINKEKAEKNFGHMLQAFKYGTPPHGGIAWGLDRFIMLLEGEPNIREVMAFPKTGDGRDLMMEAPSEADEKQLKELKIKFEK
ncbi:MAG: aspartate--tRNA ligase [Candidatus Paceibacterota bacterium]